MIAGTSALAQDLAAVMMRWEGVPEISLFLDNAAGDSKYVRVQILTLAGVLDRDKQLGVVKEMTGFVASAADDPSLVKRTWALITESPEGGRGINGHAYTGGEIAEAACRELTGS